MMAQEFQTGGSMMECYDPLESPPPEEWLDIDEAAFSASSRTIIVAHYTERVRFHLPVDDRGEQETRPVVVELDEPAAALGRKMKIPGAEEADLRPSQLRNHRRLTQGRRLPGHAAGDAIE